MEKIANNHQSNKSVAVIKIHDDYCNGSDENLMEQHFCITSKRVYKKNRGAY